MSSTAGTESVDRQRQRAQRAAGGAGGPSRLPAAPKRRRPAVAALAALLVVGGALVAGLLAVRMDERQSVVQVRQDMPVGHKITPDDLTVTRVAADVPSLVAEAEGRQAIGLYAKVAVSKGQLLDKAMLSRQAPLQPGKAAVGIALTAGRYPAGGLNSGDLVQLVRIGQATAPGAVLGQGVVLEVSQQTEKGSGLGEKAASSADQSVTVLIDLANVSAVADASGNNKIAIALLRRGTSLQGGIVGLYVLAAAKGSPGVTTSAVVLSGIWPGEPILADLDPAGGDIALRYRDASGAPLDPNRGLLSLGAAVRRGAAEVELSDHVQEIAGGLEVLTGVTSPDQVQGLGSTWQHLAKSLRSVPGRDVIADCGRLAPGAATMPVLQSADAVLMLARPTLEGLSHLRELIRGLSEMLHLGGYDAVPVGSR